MGGLSLLSLPLLDCLCLCVLGPELCVYVKRQKAPEIMLARPLGRAASRRLPNAALRTTQRHVSNYFGRMSTPWNPVRLSIVTVVSTECAGC